MVRIPYVAAALAVCAGAIIAADITTDYDHKADFSRYHTYSWIGIKAGDSIWQKRIQSDIDSELAAKGWTRVESGGDAAVAAFGKSTEQDTLQTFYDSFPGWRWGGWGAGTATTTVETEKVGNLVVSIFDGQSRDLIWRGTATDTLSGKPEKNAEKLEDSVRNLFKHFPPRAIG